MNRYFDDYATKDREDEPDHIELLTGVLKALMIGFSIAIFLTTSIILIIGPMILTTFLILSIALLVELRQDYVQIVKKKQNDDHKRDVYKRAIIIVACAVLDAIANHRPFTWLQVGQSALLGAAWFWLLFDYILNYYIHRPILSLGNSSWLDKKLSGWPWWAVLFAKIWLFGVAIGVYYHWDMIVHAWPK